MMIAVILTKVRSGSPVKSAQHGMRPSFSKVGCSIEPLEVESSSVARRSGGDMLAHAYAHAGGLV